MVSWVEAARQALRIIGEPASIPEIWIEIKDRLYKTSGETPDKTLRNEIRKHLKGYDHPEARGRRKYFVRIRRGVYGLIEWKRSELVSPTEPDSGTILPIPEPLEREGNIIPEEIEDPNQYLEGATRTISVTVYERNSEAKEVCINHYGASCVCCKFSFEKKYGSEGAGYIHVHHLRPLSEIDGEYQVDPIKDLRPVCANCHAMLHRYQPPLSIERLKEILRSARQK
jgi:hypothetical protein